MAGYKLTNKAVEDLAQIWNIPLIHGLKIKQTSIILCYWRIAKCLHPILILGRIIRKLHKTYWALKQADTSFFIVELKIMK